MQQQQDPIHAERQFRNSLEVTGEKFMNNHWHLNLQREDDEDFLITAEVKKIADGTIVCVTPFKPASWREISLASHLQRTWLLRQLVQQVWNLAVQEQKGAHHVVFDSNGLPNPDPTNHGTTREQFWERDIFQPMGLSFLKLAQHTASHGWLVVPRGDEALFIERLGKQTSSPLHGIHNFYGRSPATRRL